MQRVDNNHDLGEFVFQSMHPIKDATSKEHCKLNNTLFQSMHPIKDATRWAFESFGSK